MNSELVSGIDSMGRHREGSVYCSQIESASFTDTLSVGDDATEVKAFFDRQSHLNENEKPIEDTERDQDNSEPELIYDDARSEPLAAAEAAAEAEPQEPPAAATSEEDLRPTAPELRRRRLAALTQAADAEPQEPLAAVQAEPQEPLAAVHAEPQEPLAAVHSEPQEPLAAVHAEPQEPPAAVHAEPLSPTSETWADAQPMTPLRKELQFPEYTPSMLPGQVTQVSTTSRTSIATTATAS